MERREEHPVIADSMSSDEVVKALQWETPEWINSSRWESGEPVAKSSSVRYQTRITSTTST